MHRPSKTTALSLFSLALGACVFLLAKPTPLVGSIVLTSSDKISMELGLRFVSVFSVLQVIQEDAESTSQSNRNLDSFFDLRQTRLRFGANLYNTKVFIQTDITNTENTSTYLNLVDAVFIVDFSSWLRMYLGIHLPPSHRESVTSSLTSLSIARPIISTKPLTWFNQNVAAYFDDQRQVENDYFENSFDPKVPISLYENRDLGVTFFGTHSFSPVLHVKYYSGVYNGSEVQQEASPQILRFTERLQVNLLDAEPGYFCAGTYLGSLRTIAFGASVDFQNLLATMVPSVIKTHYLFYSFDAFAELPLTKSLSITLESALLFLDLDGEIPTKEGFGWYAQTALLWGKVQPWASLEEWTSDSTDFGDLRSLRLGLTTFFAEHDLKVSVGWEFVRAEKFGLESAHHTFIAALKVNI